MATHRTSSSPLKEQILTESENIRLFSSGAAKRNLSKNPYHEPVAQGLNLWKWGFELALFWIILNIGESIRSQKGVKKCQESVNFDPLQEVS